VRDEDEAPPETLRVFTPLSLRGRGTHPVAWRSQFHGCTGWGRACAIKIAQTILIPE